MKPLQKELWQDATFLLVVLVNWLVATAIADACSPGRLAKRLVAGYVAAVAVGVNGYSLVRSASFLGRRDAPSESIAGLFFEIVNLTQVWGTLFALVRYLSLPSEHGYHSESLLRAVAESVFEMALVQAGVGWASEAPTTLLERLVAWMAAYVGGVLCTNLFLVSVVLGRRGHWEREPLIAAPERTSASVTAAATAVPMAVRVPWMASLK